MRVLYESTWALITAGGTSTNVPLVASRVTRFVAVRLPTTLTSPATLERTMFEFVPEAVIGPAANVPKFV